MLINAYCSRATNLKNTWTANGTSRSRTQRLLRMQA